MSEPPRNGAEESPSRLDQISTRWSLLHLAHQGPSGLAAPARSALVLRYSRSIQSYIRALVRDENDSADLAQEVLVRLLQGDFAGADPSRGRFRDFLKVSVRNRVRTFWTRRRRHATADHDLSALPDDDPGASDDAWLASWREGILDLAWRALEAFEHQMPGNLSYTLLRLRADEPELDGKELAEELGERVGRDFRADAVRQQLRRARLRFARNLVEEVAKGLDDIRPTALEEELRETGLMDYVRDFLPEDWSTTGELR